MQTVASCPSDADLELFLLGRLDDARSQVLEVHLDGCKTCMDRVAGVTAEDDMVRAMRKENVPAADPELAVGMVNPPFSFMVREQGLKSLGSQFDLLGPYQATGAFVMRAWAGANTSMLVNYLAAYIEGQRSVLNPANRAAMVQLLMRQFKQTEGVAQSSYDTLVAPGSGLAVDARFNPPGFATVLAIRAEMEGLWGGHPPAAGKYLDSTYFDQAQGVL